MWKIYGRAYSVALIAAIALCGFAVNSANAQNTFINQNISGFNLPGVQLPQGHDEVRAADGTTCRSAVSGNGAYLDVGVIGNPEQSTTDSSLSAYTRVVIPLGQKRARVDCSKLYNLEVRRLEIELKLMELGLNRGIAPASETAAEVSNDVQVADNSQTGFGSENGDATASSKSKKSVEVASAEGDDWAKDGWTTEGLSE